jgi:hypothetical protein
MKTQTMSMAGNAAFSLTHTLLVSCVLCSMCPVAHVATHLPIHSPAECPPIPLDCPATHLAQRQGLNIGEALDLGCGWVMNGGREESCEAIVCTAYRLDAGGNTGQRQLQSTPLLPNLASVHNPVTCCPEGRGGLPAWVHTHWLLCLGVQCSSMTPDPRSRPCERRQLHLSCRGQRQCCSLLRQPEVQPLAWVSS